VPLRRHNSEVNIRQAFPPTTQTELPGLETELKKIQDELNTSDKRHLGSVIGAGVFGLLGFLLLSPTAIGGIAGGVVGLGVGHLVGRSLRKRRKIALSDVNMDKVYQLRLTCLLRYLEKKMRAKTSLELFLRIIERVVCEFRPAMVLELHNLKLAKMVDRLVKLLRRDACHTALLNGFAELTHLQSSSSVTLFVTRLKYFFIPVMELMRYTGPHKAQLEVVLNVERLLEEKEVQELLSRHSRDVEAVIGGVLQRSDSSSMMCLSPEFTQTAAKVDGAFESSREEQSGNHSLRRSTSLYDESPSRNSYRQQVESLVIRSITSAYNDGNRSPINLPAVTEIVEEEKTPRGEMASPSQRFSQRARPPQMEMIIGTTNELMEEESSGEEQQGSPLIDQVELQDINPVLREDEKKGPEATIIELKVHPFQEDFDRLLVIEAEPRSDKTWQHVIDKPGVQVFKKKTEGTPICMIKAFCAIPYSKEVVFRAIWDTEMRSRWDEVFEEFRIIDTQPDFDVLYYMIKVRSI